VTSISEKAATKIRLACSRKKMSSPTVISSEMAVAANRPSLPSTPSSKTKSPITIVSNTEYTITRLICVHTDDKAVNSIEMIAMEERIISKSG